MSEPEIRPPETNPPEPGPAEPGPPEPARDQPGPPAPEPGGAPRGFRRRAWLVLLLVALSVAGLDQLTKRWAHQTLRGAPRLNVVDSCLSLSYVRNPGAVWGFLAHTNPRYRHPFFVAVSLAAMLFILYIHRRLEPGQHLLLLAISLVMGGAVGNFIDRLQLRYVIDFIELHWRHRFHWPTFNVADVAISVGVGLLLLEMLFGPRWRQRRIRLAAEGNGGQP